MIQFVIEAIDHTDAEGLSRRMAVRAKHLEGMAVLKANGQFLIGGAKINDEGKMIGSTMVVQFPTENDFEAYFKQEPYVTGNVWGKINVYKFRVAPI